MRKTDAPTLSDFLKLGETVLSVLLGTAQELGHKASGKRDTLVRKLDLVTREEFDVAFAMIKKARAQQDSLDKRLTAIEKKLALSSPTQRKAKKQIRSKT